MPAVRLEHRLSKTKAALLRRRRLGQNVRRLRAEHSMSKSELAARLGVSLGQVYHIELGESSPSMEVYAKLVEIFGGELPLMGK